MAIRASREVVEASEVFASLLEAKSARSEEGSIAPGSDELWEQIIADGWADLGASEDHGGADLDLRNLSEIVMIWGKALVPLPFVPTLMVRRWYRGESGGLGGTDRFTYGVPLDTDMIVSPFGAEARVHCVLGLGQSTVSLGESADGEWFNRDDFAPSLPLGRHRAVSENAGSVRRELQALYAAEAVGCAVGALERAISYAKERTQFGRPISEFQAVRHRIADMWMDAEFGKSAVLWACLDQTDADRACLAALERAQRVVESAIQVHGGFGYTWDAGIHFWLRHILTLRRLVGLSSLEYGV